MAKFPTEEWLNALMEKLNSDEKYAGVAKKWEGDMIFQIEPSGSLEEETSFYLDLWHGKCRSANMITSGSNASASFTLCGSYDNYVRLLKSDLDPMQALLTRKLGVQGNMAVLMRSVPVVLDFVRCCREVTDEYL
jgi:putative sterol carrier protein